MQFDHIPVMLSEVLSGLDVKPGGVYLDCTLGGGGHSKHILQLSAPDGFLVGIDQDQEAITAADAVLSEYSGRYKLYKTNFSDLKHVIDDSGIDKADGVLMDLGVSSYQLDNAERGFSYMQDAPLDMRMDQKSGATAADLINTLSEAELTKIIGGYGEERWAKRISQFIVNARKKERIATTGQLVTVIKQAIPAGARKEGSHPAKKTFQALRIAVNDELGILRSAIMDAVDILRPGGRICIITFHSLEDRIVKGAFHYLTLNCICPPRIPVCTCNVRQKVKLINKKPIIPSQEEIDNNPRAHSAKLRIAEKI